LTHLTLLSLFEQQLPVEQVEQVVVELQRYELRW
jgi:hypothetical protein